MERAETEGLLRALGAEESQLTDVERAGLDTDGYVILRGALSAEQLANVRAAIDRLIAQARLDPTWHAGGTLHLNDLVNDAAFDPVWKSARLLAAIVHILGYDLKIGSVAYRAPKPGYGAQTLHADYMQGYSGDYMVATAIVALVDFTAENGPTRIVPGSHVQRHAALPSDADAPHPGERAAHDVQSRLGDCLQRPRAAFGHAQCLAGNASRITDHVREARRRRCGHRADRKLHARTRGRRGIFVSLVTSRAVVQIQVRFAPVGSEMPRSAVRLLGKRPVARSDEPSAAGSADHVTRIGAIVDAPPAG